MSCNHELHPHCGCCGAELCPDYQLGGYCGEPRPVSPAWRAHGVTAAVCAIDVCLDCAADPQQPTPLRSDDPTLDWDPADARCPKHGGPFKLTSFDQLDLHVQQRALTLAEANRRILEWADHRRLLAQFMFEEFVIDDPFIGPTNEGDVDPVAFYGLAFLRSEYCQLAEWPTHGAGEAPTDE